MLGLFSAISELAAEYPKITSVISVGAIFAAFWAYWKRPIINVRLAKSAGSHAGTPLVGKNAQGENVEVEVKYFRLRIKNIGMTTVKNCSGQLIKVTRRVPGQELAIFDTETYRFGWAHYSQSETLDIPCGMSFHMDVATLGPSRDGRSQLFFGGMGRVTPNTLAKFFNSFSGKATYRFDLLISADNARPKKVPVEVVFDPEQTELSFIPLNTRYPWWRLWWWLRASVRDLG
jgi:hypothetical protein